MRKVFRRLRNPVPFVPRLRRRFDVRGGDQGPEAQPAQGHHADHHPGRRHLLGLAYITHLVLRVSTFNDVDSAAIEVIGKAGGELLVAFFTAAYIAGSLGSALTCQASVSRIIHSMGRSGALLAFLGRLHARFKTAVSSSRAALNEDEENALDIHSLMPSGTLLITLLHLDERTHNEHDSTFGLLVRR